MNNQNYQILLGIILLVVYFTFFRESEGFLGLVGGKRRSGPRDMIGKTLCFRNDRMIGDSAAGADVSLGSAGLARGGRNNKGSCKDGTFRRVVAQAAPVSTYYSYRKRFKKKRRYRNFKRPRGQGWRTMPLPEGKKAGQVLLDLAQKGYQSFTTHNMGKSGGIVRFNRKKLPLTSWSGDKNTGIPSGSMIFSGFTDRTQNSLRRTKKRLRKCQNNLKAVQSLDRRRRTQGAQPDSYSRSYTPADLAAATAARKQANNARKQADLGGAGGGGDSW